MDQPPPTDSLLARWQAAWPQALALGYRVAVRPSRREPFTGHRLVHALRQSGFRDHDVMFLPTDYAGADVVVLLNGDRITGKIEGRATRRFRLQTPYGLLLIPRERVTDALLIFVVPPSMETLFARLKSRATETVDELHEAVIQCVDCLHDQPHLTLLDGRIDVAVHSLKDLPTIPTDGLDLAARHERQRRLELVLVLDDQRVGKVDAARFDANAHLSRSDSR